jgi:hypothetical protein
MSFPEEKIEEWRLGILRVGKGTIGKGVCTDDCWWMRVYLLR